MATTKKSSSGKTKTAKKPVTKATKSATTTKKSVSTKSVKLPSAKSVSVPRLIGSRTKVRELHFITVALNVGLAVAAGFVMSTRAYQLVTGLLSKDELASRTTTVFAPAIHSVYDLELRWALVAILALASVTSLLVLTKFKHQYQASLTNRIHTWRWIDMAVVGALMVEVIALLSGVQDIMTLKLIGGVVAVSSLLAWLAERQNSGNQKPARALYILSVITALLPWGLIGSYAIATYIYGMVRSPWYVYALYAVGVAGVVAVALNLRNQLLRNKAGSNYETVERNYLVTNILTRTAFAVILILGLKI